MASKKPRRDTHFVCFPLVTADSAPQLITSLAHFRELTTAITPLEEREVEKAENDELCSTNDVRLIPAAAHRPPGTFHLTLGTMDLSTESRMDEALELLQQIDYQTLLQEVENSIIGISGQQEISGNASETLDVSMSGPSDRVVEKDKSSLPGPTHVSLRGLGAFSSAQKARVFYAHPYDATGWLYKFALTVRERFKEAGFINETRPLVLHATVANMSYANRNKRHGRGRRRGRHKDTIDATDIIRVFDKQGGIMRNGENQKGKEEKYIWAQNILVDRVRICKMGAEKAEDESLGLEYKPVGEKMICNNT